MKWGLVPPRISLEIVLFFNLRGNKSFCSCVCQMASSLGEGAFRWIKQFIEKLPIPKITQSNQSIADSIIALVDEILNLKSKDSTANTSELESDIDNLVYALYDLNNEEIAIVDT